MNSPFCVHSSIYPSNMARRWNWLSYFSLMDHIHITKGNILHHTCYPVGSIVIHVTSGIQFQYLLLQNDVFNQHNDQLLYLTRSLSASGAQTNDMSSTSFIPSSPLFMNLPLSIVFKFSSHSLHLYICCIIAFCISNGFRVVIPPSPPGLSIRFHPVPKKLSQILIKSDTPATMFL